MGQTTKLPLWLVSGLLSALLNGNINLLFSSLWSEVLNLWTTMRSMGRFQGVHDFLKYLFIYVFILAGPGLIYSSRDLSGGMWDLVP